MYIVHIMLYVWFDDPAKEITAFDYNAFIRTRVYGGRSESGRELNNPSLCVDRFFDEHVTNINEIRFMSVKLAPQYQAGTYDPPQNFRN